MSNVTLAGSCLCGAVRYSATGEPLRFYHCHCSRCRKVTGTGHASNLFLKGSLTWLSGESQVASYQLPQAQRFTNSFCPQCGSRVPKYIEKAGIAFIPAGSLDEEPGIGVHARIFRASGTAWSCDSSVLPEYDEFPPP